MATSNVSCRWRCVLFDIQALEYCIQVTHLHICTGGEKVRFSPIQRAISLNPKLNLRFGSSSNSVRTRNNSICYHLPTKQRIYKLWVIVFPFLSHCNFVLYCFRGSLIIISFFKSTADYVKCSYNIVSYELIDCWTSVYWFSLSVATGNILYHLRSSP